MDIIILGNDGAAGLFGDLLFLFRTSVLLLAGMCNNYLLEIFHTFPFATTDSSVTRERICD